MALYEVIDIFCKKEYTKDSPDVLTMVEDLKQNPGSYIIDNELIFYALYKCKYLSNFIEALRASQRFYGESPAVQKHLLKLKELRDNIETVDDQIDWCCTVITVMETIRKQNLRVSNASMNFAREHFGEFEEFMNTLDNNRVDMPVYNFTDEVTI